MKTEQDIERDFYRFISESEIGHTIRGSIYRDGMRPTNAETEDLVIKFLEGTDAQFQSGIVVLNLYVPDIPIGDGRKSKDFKRISTLQNAVNSFFDSGCGNEYDITKDATPKTLRNEDIEQHFIYVRIKFRRADLYV